MEGSWTIVRRPRAVDDLFDIWNYIANDDPAIAGQWMQRLEDGILRLKEFPRLGATRALLPTDVRVWPVAPFLVLYRLEAEARRVRILRIIDGRRDLGTVLLS